MLLYLAPSAGPSSDAWLSPASDQMRRREFIATVGGAVSGPVAVRAQQSTLPVIGFMISRSREYLQRVMVL